MSKDKFQIQKFGICGILLAMRAKYPSNLEKFVMGDVNAPVNASELIVSRLAGYAYRVLPENHPLRAELRHARRNLEIQHQLVKRQFLPLLKAWNAAGLKIMAIKGFWLAEFVYERPGDRGYGDIDLLIPEEQSQKAVQIARENGWKVTIERKTSGNQNSHEEAHIVSSDGLVIIDLHRFALQNARTWGQHHPKRLTRAFWNLAIKHEWEGTSVWLLSPIDGLMLNFINRARGDHWARRPSDLIDAKAIVACSHFTLEQLMGRANELHVKNAIQIALTTCNPWSNQTNCTNPVGLKRFLYGIITANEIGLFEIDQKLFFFGRIINAITALPIMLPTVMKVKQALKNHQNLNQIFQILEKEYLPKTHSDSIELVRLKRSTHLALYILGPRHNACVPRSMALYLILRQRNFPVQFVSGVKRSQGKLIGHAWIELYGRPLENLGDHAAPELFKENFRYPV